VQSGLNELDDTVGPPGRSAPAPGADGQLSHSRGTITEAWRNETGVERADPAAVGPERAFWSWLGFWVQMLVLAVLAIIGAFAASAAEHSGDYACGMILVLAAIALAFLRLKHRLDGGGAGVTEFLLVDDLWNLALVIPLFTVIGLAGLFIAHGAESGDLHFAGIALFLASGAVIFLDLKHVFDRLEGAGRR
jgi:hypothetical protein